MHCVILTLEVGMKHLVLVLLVISSLVGCGASSSPADPAATQGTGGGTPTPTPVTTIMKCHGTPTDTPALSYFYQVTHHSDGTVEVVCSQTGNQTYSTTEDWLLSDGLNYSLAECHITTFDNQKYGFVVLPGGGWQLEKEVNGLGPEVDTDFPSTRCTYE